MPHAHCGRPGGHRQTGVSTVIIVVVLMLILSVGLLTALKMSGTSVIGTALQNDSVEAVFLAESGVERASQRYINGAVACNALGPDTATFARGTATISAPVAGFDPTLDFAGNPLPGNRCRIRSTGRITGSTVQRQIEAIVERGGGGGAYSFANAAEINPPSPPGAVSTWTNFGPAGGYNTAFCPGAPAVVPGPNNLPSHFLANDVNRVLHSATEPPGPTPAPGSLHVRTVDGVNGNNPGGQVAGYRENTLASTIPAGTALTVSLWFRKSRSGGNPVSNIAALDLVATDGTIYRLWCNSSTGNVAWQQTAPIAFTVPAGKTIDRVRLVFDAKNKSSGGGIGQLQTWFDELSIGGGGGGAVGLKAWREIVR